jgi:hypothetical protein
MKKKPKGKQAKAKKMKKVMGEFKAGSLKSGSGDTVKKRKQAVAIGLKQSGQSFFDRKRRVAAKKKGLGGRVAKALS